MPPLSGSGAGAWELSGPVPAALYPAPSDVAALVPPPPPSSLCGWELSGAVPAAL